MSDQRMIHFRMLLAVGIAVFLLAGCSSTVVKKEPGAGSGRSVSAGKPGTTLTVQRGDTLYGLAFRNGVDFRELASWNRIGPPYTIYPGQRLRLYPQSGSSRTTATTTRAPPAAGKPRPSSPSPAERRPATGPAAPASSGFAWRWPADGQVIARFVAGDATRQGVGIGGSAGQPVRSAGDGVVVYSGAGLVGYGELIIIKHSESWLSAYGHNRKRLVNEGQNVKAGQQIAEMGRSGAARDMLHFEIRYNGKPVDPLLYLPKR